MFDYGKQNYRSGAMIMIIKHLSGSCVCNDVKSTLHEHVVKQYKKSELPRVYDLETLFDKLISNKLPENQNIHHLNLNFNMTTLSSCLVTTMSSCCSLSVVSV